MSVSSPATAIEKGIINPPSESGAGRNFRLWLRVWIQVFIAELLHVLDHRSSSHARYRD